MHRVLPVVLCLLLGVTVGCESPQQPLGATEGASEAAPEPTSTPTSAPASAPDLAYLENYRLSPSVEQQLADARARGIQGDIHIPAQELPPPWLKPELHGPFLLTPHGWIGALPSGSESRPLTPWGTPQASGPPTEEAIRASALWREPANVPERFTLRDVTSERLGHAVTQHWTRPVATQASLSEIIALQWWTPASLPVRVDTWADSDQRLFEPTTIDGHPAVIYQALARKDTTIWIFNEDEGVVYVGQSGAVSAGELLAMVRSLYR